MKEECVQLLKCLCFMLTLNYEHLSTKGIQNICTSSKQLNFIKKSSVHTTFQMHACTEGKVYKGVSAVFQWIAEENTSNCFLCWMFRKIFQVY